jgi:enoyl-CoA hydratase/carnithine racemase
MDLAEMRSIREAAGSYDYELLPKVFERLGSYRKPTVAMVHGAAIAGGCELALHCDLRIGSPAAKFAMPLARLGLVIPTEPAERLVNIVGPARARDLLLTGDAVDGVEAERIGLLSRLVDAGQLVEKTEELVRRLAANAPLSLLAMKRLLDRLGHMLPPQERDAFETERLRIGGSEDMREGLRAFFERRAPVFRGV